MTGDCIVAVLDPAPEDECRQAAIVNLSVIDHQNDKKDRLKWKWFRGDETLIEAYGDPLTTTTHELCIYDEVSPGNYELKLRMQVPPSGMFRARGGTQWKYKDKSGSAGGAKVMRFFAGKDGRAKIGIKGKGAAMDTPAPYIPDLQFFALDPSLTAQLANTEGECWQSTFTTSVKNTGNKYKTRRKVLIGAGGTGG
jgi:hypothetical protein